MIVKIGLTMISTTASTSMKAILMIVLVPIILNRSNHSPHLDLVRSI